MTSDYADEFEADYNFNIEDIKIESEKVDTIICYHVLEHVLNDMQAIKELFRILKKTGTCYVQTPFKNGQTYEDSSIINPTQRLQHYGQVDHVRIYSPEDLRDRLSKLGFNVDILIIDNEKNNYNGLKEKDIILRAVKDKA